MSFLSYAQNFEDVLLWRALGHVKDGFYIDVGANDPVEHSVTKAFYDAGWRGINIEPMPSYHAVFAAQRPRDINLTVAAGAETGQITLFEVPSMNGWASTDRAVADAHRADGYEVVETEVPLRRLQDICAEHVRGDIHFLKIDVEGYEEAVLRGMDLRRWRPWVLVIEATLPGQRESSHHGWDMLVTQQGYRYAYFDGLNRYYVATERGDVFEQLGVQANVFDNFISYHLDAAWKTNTEITRAHQQELRQTRLLHAEQTAAREQAYTEANLERDRLAALDAERIAQLQEQLRAQLADSLAVQQQQAASAQELERWAYDLQARLLAVLGSRWWRLGAPLRAFGRLAPMLGRVRPGSLLRSGRRSAAAAARRLLRRLSSSDRARRLLIPLKRRVPAAAALYQRLSRPQQASAATPATAHSAPQVAATLGQLDLSEESAAVRHVLADLAAATNTTNTITR